MDAFSPADTACRYGTALAEGYAISAREGARERDRAYPRAMPNIDLIIESAWLAVGAPLHDNRGQIDVVADRARLTDRIEGVAARIGDHDLTGRVADFFDALGESFTESLDFNAPENEDARAARMALHARIGQLIRATHS